MITQGRCVEGGANFGFFQFHEGGLNISLGCCALEAEKKEGPIQSDEGC